MRWDTITRLERAGQLPVPTGPKYEDDFVVGKHLLTSDQHGRFVDQQAWSAVLSLLDSHPFDSFTFNGDFTDMYELSRYEKDPDVERCVTEDFNAAKEHGRDVRDRHDGPIIYNPGNHEERYERYLRTDARKLRGLKILELPAVLELARIDATMNQADGYLLTDSCRIYHGTVVRSQPGASARGELESWGMSGCSGHVHRLAVHHASGHLLKSWAESGCLCSLRPEYSTKPVNWQHGCVIAHELASGEVIFELVRIYNGQIIRL